MRGRRTCLGAPGLSYEGPPSARDYDLVAYAQALGLDLMKFRTQLLRGAYTLGVRQDFLGGIRSGSNGAPTFFVNGRRREEIWNPETLLAMIEAQARRQKPAPIQGKPD